jgi:site-specific recombinase XerD
VERSLTPAVAKAYSHWVHPFVEHFVDQDEDVPFAQLRAVDVTGFLTAHLPRLSRKSAQITACALRSFLRFLQAQGMTQVALAEAVSAIGFWKLSRLPQALSPSQVQELLGACDRSTPVGRRDFAVITILARLGLRSNEASALRLEDVDWASGTVAIHGKGNRIDKLPLPVDVGQALVEYLREGRPADTPARTVFVRAVAPFTELGPSSLSCIVGRAAQRAGLGKIHAHRLRHTAATQTLNAGASLEEVAQLLRHASPSGAGGRVGQSAGEAYMW